MFYPTLVYSVAKGNYIIDYSLGYETMTIKYPTFFSMAYHPDFDIASEFKIARLDGTCNLHINNQMRITVSCHGFLANHN